MGQRVRVTKVETRHALSLPAFLQRRRGRPRSPVTEFYRETHSYGMRFFVMSISTERCNPNGLQTNSHPVRDVSLGRKKALYNLTHPVRDASLGRKKAYEIPPENSR